MQNERLTQSYSRPSLFIRPRLRVENSGFAAAEPFPSDRRPKASADCVDV
jgi:hypothetical protein